MQPRCPAGCWLCRRAAPFPRSGRLGAACGESVVSAVPNPKWLLRNGNPIKVLLVYLSSSGLFITVQMAATFARHSSVLARARRTEARTPQSLCLHLRGDARPPAPALPAGEPGSARLPERRHPFTSRIPPWAVFAPGICTMPVHRPFAPGHFFAPAHFFAPRHFLHQGIFFFFCIGHPHRVFTPGIGTGRSNHVSAPGYSYRALAPGVCTGHP